MRDTLTFQPQSVTTFGEYQIMLRGNRSMCVLVQFTASLQMIGASRSRSRNPSITPPGCNNTSIMQHFSAVRRNNVSITFQSPAVNRTQPKSRYCIRFTVPLLC